jgi:hypothetical protein
MASASASLEEECTSMFMCDKCERIFVTECSETVRTNLTCPRTQCAAKAIFVQTVPLPLSELVTPPRDSRSVAPPSYESAVRQPGPSPPTNPTAKSGGSAAQAAGAESAQTANKAKPDDKAFGVPPWIGHANGSATAAASSATAAASSVSCAATPAKVDAALEPISVMYDNKKIDPDDQQELDGQRQWLSQRFASQFAYAKEHKMQSIGVSVAWGQFRFDTPMVVTYAIVPVEEAAAHGKYTRGRPCAIIRTDKSPIMHWKIDIGEGPSCSVAEKPVYYLSYR